jgi:hypothetical protein
LTGLTLDTIHCADALTVLRTLPDGCVNCIVTSPPYFGLRDYGNAAQIGAEPTPAAYVAALVGVLRECKRVSSPGDHALVNRLYSLLWQTDEPFGRATIERVITALGPGFDRACAGRLDPVEGIAFARRFWLDLRASTLESGDRTNTGSRRRRREIRRPRGVRAPDLRTFAATRPMRYWLAERLLGSLETELGRAASAAERLDTVEEVRTLRIPAPMAAGAETRRG